MNQELSGAWGTWLSGLEEWQWFVTMTFRDPPATTPGYSKVGWAHAKSAWRTFEKLARPACGELLWARAMEIQPWRGVPHWHALVGGLDSTRYRDVSNSLWKNFGFCRILDFDPELGAGYYIAKYATKELGDIEFSPSIRAR